MVYILLVILTPLLVLADSLTLLEKKLEEIRTLRASFIQKVQYSWYPKPEVSKGFFYAQKGGKFRIEYEQPQRMLIVSDGKKILIYDPEENTAILDRVERNRSAVVEALFLLSRPLRDVFDKVGEISKNNGHVIVLKPKVQDPYFSRVYVEVDGWRNIKSIKVEEKDGSFTTVELVDVKYNFTPSEDLFRITVPKGVKVRQI